ncbi:MAG: DUF3842 family protein [Oscillospiraceae bacterium]|jgi:NAD(P)-dependent dehydrogenase (short-subunit alcohol dehydrogenase family)|nr:DUF3842 family protein [Oscillospiraceae bacterium]
MYVAVVDGQGGGLGRAIVEKLRAVFGAEVEIIALGTNAMAASVMIKAGADEGASGENAIVVNARKADFIIGSVAIIAADSMLGEITAPMAAAVARSPAKKILLPLNRCGILVAGIKPVPLMQYIDEAVAMVKEPTEN